MTEMLPIPKNFRLHITNRCNHQCVMCDRWSWRKEEQKKDLQELNTREYMSFLDDLTALGIRKITFTGGEPSLRTDLPELIGHALPKMSVSIVTNGQLLSQCLGKWLEIPGIPGRSFSVAVSLLGLQGTHDKHCNIDGSFQKAFSGIKSLVAFGISTTIFFTVLPGNLKDIVPAYETAREIGVQSIRFGLLHGYGGPSFSDAELASLQEEFTRLSQILYKKDESGRKRKVFSASYPWYIHRMLADGTIPISEFQQKVLSRSILNTPRHCPYVDNLVFMNPYGDIYPCHFAEFSNQDYGTYQEQRASFVMGDIRKQKILEIWQSPVYEAFRRRVHPIAPGDKEIRVVCEQCEYLCEDLCREKMGNSKGKTRSRRKSKVD